MERLTATLNLLGLQEDLEHTLATARRAMDTALQKHMLDARAAGRNLLAYPLQEERAGGSVRMRQEFCYVEPGADVAELVLGTGATLFRCTEPPALSLEQMRGVAERLGYAVLDLSEGRACVHHRPSNDFSGDLPTREAAEREAWAAARAANQLFLHRKGGIYRLLHRGRHTDDLAEVVIYEHLWPHARGVWVRPAAEFDDVHRFAPL